MKKLLLGALEVVIAGFVITLAITIVGSYAAAYTMTPDMSETDVYVRALYIDLLLWWILAAVIVSYHRKKIDIGNPSFILRQIFLWGPINLAWYLTAQGYDGVFVLGMMASSAMLYYEEKVWGNAPPRH